MSDNKIYYSNKLKNEIIAQYLSGQKLHDIFLNHGINEETLLSQNKKYASKLISSWIKKSQLDKNNIIKLHQIVNNNNLYRYFKDVDFVENKIDEFNKNNAFLSDY